MERNYLVNLRLIHFSTGRISVYLTTPSLNKSGDEQKISYSLQKLKITILFYYFSGCKIKALRAKTNTYIKTPVRGEEPVFVVSMIICFIFVF